jgi:hypothetical protein
MKYGTVFVESELILATAQDDPDYIQELLGNLLPGEIERLRQAAYALADHCETEMYRRLGRQPAPPPSR